MVPCASVHQGSIVKKFNMSTVNKTDQDWNSNIAFGETLHIIEKCSSMNQNGNSITSLADSIGFQFVWYWDFSKVSSTRKSEWDTHKIISVDFNIGAIISGSICFLQHCDNSLLIENVTRTNLSFVCFHCPGCTEADARGKIYFHNSEVGRGRVL